MSDLDLSLGLDDLVGDVPRFFSHHWGQRFLLRRGAIPAERALITPDELDGMLDMPPDPRLGGIPLVEPVTSAVRPVRSFSAIASPC
jgi:hypothetical protein